MDYIGSKKKLAASIYEIIDSKTDLNQFEFIDLFAGTGAVASEFKKNNHFVYANDIQKYSFVINSFLIATELPNIDLSFFEKKVTETEGFFYKNYSESAGRMYFTDTNAKIIDCYRKMAKDFLLPKEDYFYFLTSLIESVSSVSNTTGVYEAFLKQFKKRALKKITLKNIEQPRGRKGIALNYEAKAVTQNFNADVFYLDPPYNSRQYSSNYHIYETLVSLEDPKIKGKTGQPVNNFKSAYCSKVKAKNEFYDLIKSIKSKYIFISYNSEGILSKQELFDILNQFGKTTIEETKYKRFKSQKVKSEEFVTEYLFCCQR